MEIEQKTVVPEYKWAGEVKELYKYTCIFCGKQQTGRLMHAHHVVPKHTDPTLANVLENGVALCHRCHRYGIHEGNGEIRAGGLADQIASVIQTVKDNEIILSLPKGKKEVVQASAARHGLSVNAYINAAIDEKIERDNAAAE